MSPQHESGRPRLDPAVLAYFRRRRITTALSDQARRKGYRKTTVADVVRAAGIARNTFYDQFPSKEAAFLALMDECVAEVGELVEAACRQAGPDPRARRRAGLEALLGWGAENGARAHSLLIASFAAGEKAVTRRAAAESTFAELYGRALDGVEVPPHLAELLVGGLAVILVRLLVDGREAGLLDRAEDLAAVLDLVELWTDPDRRC